METLDLEPITINPSTFLYDECRLPALPKVLTRFQEAMQDDDVTVRDVIGIVSSDPGIVAEVLRVVNSAYFGLPRAVSRIDTAVAYLGIQEVHNIVLASSVISTFDIKDLVAFKRVWYHSLYTALCARHLALRFASYLPAGTLWAPALLHDIGKLVYLQFFPDHFGALQRTAETEGCLFSEAEQAFGWPSSAFLGTLLCECWGLPDTIKHVCAVQGVEALTNPELSASLPLLQRMVVLGDLVSTLATDTLQTEKRLLLAEAIQQTLDLTESDFLVLMGAITDLKLEAGRMAA